MSRRRHPDKEIEATLKFAEFYGWRIDVGGSHAWGRIRCPFNKPSCRHQMFCQQMIWTTPKNPSSHARALKRGITGCRFFETIQEK